MSSLAHSGARQRYRSRPRVARSAEEPISVGGDGTIPVPQEPGLGLRIDAKRLRRFGRRFYKGTRLSVAVGAIRQKGLGTALELAKRKEAAARRGGDRL